MPKYQKYMTIGYIFLFAPIACCTIASMAGGSSASAFFTGFWLIISIPTATGFLIAGYVNKSRLKASQGLRGQTPMRIQGPAGSPAMPAALHPDSLTIVMMPPFAWQGDKYVAQYRNCTPLGAVEITIVGNSTRKISQQATGDGWLAVEIDTSPFAVGEYRCVARDIQSDTTVAGAFKIYQRQQQPLPSAHRLLNNRFDEIKLIKTGGMATITKARDTKTGEYCIIKKALPDPDPDTRKIFNDKLALEAVYLRSFNHPSIIKFIDMFTYEGELFLVVEFIDGDDLGHLFAKVPAGEQKTLQLARQILSALDYIHCQGMVHRDFNPGNIMMRKDNAIVIIDFGTVKSSSASPGLTLVEKPGFAAPEQAISIYDVRTDIYQAGGTLYYLLTCASPGSLAGSDVYKALIRKGVSDRTAGCLAQALRFEPNQRFQSVRVMSQALGL